MKQEDPLFQLIKALSKSEKRYFRMHAGSGEEKYLLLFSALDAMEEYDESRLRQMLEGEKLLNQLHVSKNYLFELVLRTLRSYATGRTVYMRLLNYLGDYDNLNRIGLPSLANKRLLKARELATKYDLLPFQIHTTIEDSLFLLKSFRIDEGTDRHNTAQQETEQLAHQLLYQSLNARLVAALNGVGNAFAIEAFDAEIAMLKQEVEGGLKLNLRAQLAFSTLCFNYHKLKDELQEAFHYTEQTLAILKEHSYLIESGMYAYPMVLLNFFMLVFYSEFALRPELLERSAIDDILSELDRYTATATNEGMRAMAFVARMYIRVLWLSYMGNDEEVLECFATDWPRLLDTPIQNAIIVESELLYYRVRALLSLGQFRSALEQLNCVMNDKRYDQKLDASWHLLSLVIHFELGNTTYLPFVIRSIRHRLERAHQWNEYYQIALEVIRLLSRKAIDRNALETLRRRAVDLRASKRFNASFLAFELDRWIESKLEARSLSEIVKVYREANPLIARPSPDVISDTNT